MVKISRSTHVMNEVGREKRDLSAPKPATHAMVHSKVYKLMLALPQITVYH